MYWVITNHTRRPKELDMVYVVLYKRTTTMQEGTFNECSKEVNVIKLKLIDDWLYVIPLLCKSYAGRCSWYCSILVESFQG